MKPNLIKTLASPQCYLLPFAFCLLFTLQTLALPLPVARPESVGMSSERLARMNEVIAQAIARHETPGAVVLVARQGRVVWRKAYGSRSLVPAAGGMTTGTTFDLAPPTKKFAAATRLMIF